MAWGSNTNPVAIGAATRKVDYDDLWDKLQYVKDSVIPATTKMLFGQSSAPTGWTKDTGTWTDDSMIAFTTGSIGSGGSQSAITAHSHSHNHQWYGIGGANQPDTTFDSGGTPADMTGASKVFDSNEWGLVVDEGTTFDHPNAAMYTDSDATTYATKYQTVIAATKDTYT